MPNGRVGGILIPRDDVRRFFEAVKGDPVVGKIKGADVALAQVKRLVMSHDEEVIFLEGQDVGPGESIPAPRPSVPRQLVIHFSRKRWFGAEKTWLWVGQNHAVFEDLKKFWMDWLGRITDT